jgi:hypothetical protein
MSRRSERENFTRRIHRPIILIGSGRSGTTLLAETLGEHPSVGYWGEPRPIWMHGNAYRADHVLGKEQLTPRIGRYIDRRFATFLRDSGRTRFAEKTPSNCLRIRFIDALYPDALFVHIIRDGVGVVRSALEIRKKKPNPGLLRTRLNETPIGDWPAYLPMLFATVWRTIVLKKPARYWGAQPPGWKQWVDLPPRLAAARQWKALVGHALRDGRRLPPERYLELRFEELLEKPETTLRRVLEFTGLEADPEFMRIALERVKPGQARTWSSTLTAEEERECIEEMEPLLSELGYGPDFVRASSAVEPIE